MSQNTANPFDWQSSAPQVEIRQPEVGQVAATLSRGGSALVLGGRGMGKSVFLSQLRMELDRIPDLATLLVPGPPARLDVDACLDQLAEVLEVPSAGALHTRRMIDAWFAREDVPDRLVLLFDEFDRYAESGGTLSANPPGRGFFNDLEITRRHRRQLGVLAAGSVGVFAFRDALGSSFLSRAEHRNLRPFDRPTVAELAVPFAARGAPLSAEVLEALHLASGGVPALVAYGFQELWELPHEPTERNVAEIYAEFQERHHGYINDVHKAFADPHLSQAPRRVLELFRQSSGDLRRKELTEVCAESSGPLDLSLPDVLLVLTAAGLLHLESSVFAGDPVRGHPIPSILNLPTAGPDADGFRERLRRDLTLLLAKLHRASVDFFRFGREAGEKQLVPESVFAAHLALGFELLGWRAEREAQSVAGRTDLKLRYNGGSRVAVIEVKIWGRRGAKQAQQQVESYWSSQVEAGAVVQITDAELPDWPETYRREALEGKGTVESLPVEGFPLRACFAVRSEISEGVEAEVVHFLLRLPRR